LFSFIYSIKGGSYKITKCYYYNFWIIILIIFWRTLISHNSRNSFTIFISGNWECVEFYLLLYSFSGIIYFFLLLAFTESNIKLKVYEPTYTLGPVGYETNLTQIIIFTSTLWQWDMFYRNYFSFYRMVTIFVTRRIVGY